MSTRQQGDSGLGLEAQRSAVQHYTKSTGGQIIAWYCEVESGKKADRPELAKALAHAKHSHARLVIAKLDRLARNVAFTSAVMDSAVEFVCCDNPHANRLTLHILAAVAEDEARRISTRTKEALAAARRRGIKLGSHRPGHWKGAKRAAARLVGLQKATKVAAKLRAEQGRIAYAHLHPMILQLRSGGSSLRKVAAVLNEKGHRTVHGMMWNPVQVARVLGRASP